MPNALIEVTLPDGSHFSGPIPLIARPALVNCSPPSIKASGGERLTLTFSDAPDVPVSVTINGIPCTDITGNADGTVTVTTPAL